MAGRLSYADSCRTLQQHGLLAAGELPATPERAPRHDDDQPGVGFFRTRLADVTLDGLTLPRTFFGRSEIRAVSFRGADLSESTANWNDFVDVDFSAADLSRADLRASVFARVSFRDAALRGTDLRHAKFRSCIFADADMTGAKLTRALGLLFRLSRRQRASVAWQPPGPAPDGG